MGVPIRCTKKAAVGPCSATGGSLIQVKRIDRRSVSSWAAVASVVILLVVVAVSLLLMSWELVSP